MGTVVGWLIKALKKRGGGVKMIGNAGGQIVYKGARQNAFFKERHFHFLLFENVGSQVESGF